MRIVLLFALVITTGALLLPVAESKSVPLDGVRLVAESRTPIAELAFGKNGTKSGTGGGKNSNGGLFGSAGFVKVGTFFVGRDIVTPRDAELVAVDIR